MGTEIQVPFVQQGPRWSSSLALQRQVCLGGLDPYILQLSPTCPNIWNVIEFEVKWYKFHWLGFFLDSWLKCCCGSELVLGVHTLRYYDVKRQAAPSALPLIYQGKDLTCTVFYTSTARCNVQNYHCLDKGNDRVPITIASIWQVGFTDLCRAVHDWPAMSSRHSRKSWYKSQLLYWNVQVNYSISFSNILWTFYNVLPKHVRKTLPLLRPFCESYIVKYFEYARCWSFK